MIQKAYFQQFCETWLLSLLIFFGYFKSLNPSINNQPLFYTTAQETITNRYNALEKLEINNQKAY